MTQRVRSLCELFKSAVCVRCCDLISRLYAYTGGDPTNSTDEFGLFSIIGGPGVSAAAGTGAEGSVGFAINPGLFGQSADIGAFASVGATAGLNISADVFVGLVFLGIENVQGQTLNQNIGIGNISITIFHDPITGGVLGGTIGYGWGVTKYGYSGAYETTTMVTFRQFFAAYMVVVVAWTMLIRYC